ncbi:DUF1003 domain-containing protein [Mangrovicella endophytica]|uniref:DUF1003 domain-containing protein n=1 Tax=Mangrovicella endophytica TaxID=2066697 RepID=UPI000C9E8C8C|nr:DUF1003 domain-containing protein [Mangrovicella endophytica]
MASETNDSSKVSISLKSGLSGRELAEADAVHIDKLHPGVCAIIRQERPDLAPDALVSRSEANAYRLRYVENLLLEERGELSDLEREVARSMVEGATVSANVEQQAERVAALPDRLSDNLASFGGSWTFLIAFALVLGAWIVINAETARPFDPYPFILLNLILSCLAAIQAPIIMMSQKRQEAKDRLRSLNDYQVNLKAELEIRHLHEKVDHLLSRQWQRLAEIQRLQIELLQER